MAFPELVSRWRSQTRALRSLCLLALFSHLARSEAVIGQEQALPGGCELDPWISDEFAPGETGFYVLCVSPATTSASIYTGGVATETPVQVAWTRGAFRARIAEALDIKSTLSFETDTSSIIEWTKQPWLVFTDEGTELTPGAEEEELARHLKYKSYATSQADPLGKSPPVVLLLFEGGIWRWPTIRLGYQRSVLPGVTLRTVSRLPALFEVFIDKTVVEESAISTSMLSTVVATALNQLGPSKLEGVVDKAVRSSEQTFLDYRTNKELTSLRKATGRLLRVSPRHLNELQVLRYQEGQHYDLHRDYYDPREFPDIQRFTNREGFWHQRHATLLWYLSGPLNGGETWFPRAHGGPLPWGDWTACDERGVKVKPGNVTAVLFYSLRADGDLDEHSWHCGCPVISGTKWAANSWLMNSPIGRRRRGGQILSSERDEL